MKLYVWDRYHAGAFVIAAESAQEAADKLNAQHPNGFFTRYSTFIATAESFTEHSLHEVIETVGTTDA